MIGCCSIIAGIVFIKQAKSTTTQALKIVPETKKVEAANEQGNVEQTKIAVLDSLITIATADGQLTKNEQKILQDKASELGLDYAEHTTKIDELLQSKQQNKETSIIDKDKEKGDDFEKYVVEKFSKKYFSIVEWAGDKFVNGKYAETTQQPDLKIKFKYKDILADFAVECKYRSNYYKNGIEWCSEWQLKNYQKFASEKNIPVFVAIGVGGLATEPNELFIIPLEKIRTNFLPKEFLMKFKKPDPKENNLFFDAKTSTLR